MRAKRKAGARTKENDLLQSSSTVLGSSRQQVPGKSKEELRGERNQEAGHPHHLLQGLLATVESPSPTIAS